jgi:ubiquinone/menaquinone biosynthesis C-methylase UbiE
MHTSKGDVFSGRSALLYNFRITISGLRFIYKKVADTITLPKGGSLLDIGCGSGIILSRVLRKYGPNVELYGIDPSPEMVRKTKVLLGRNGYEAKLKIAYSDSIPFDNDKFDCIVTTLAAHHMPEEIKMKMAKEAFRVLKSGGIFYVADLGRPQSLRGKILATLSRNHGFVQNNMDIIEKAVREAGFSIISNTRQFGFVEHLISKKP